MLRQFYIHLSITIMTCVKTAEHIALVSETDATLHLLYIVL